MAKVILSRAPVHMVLVEFCSSEATLLRSLEKVKYTTSNASIDLPGLLQTQQWLIISVDNNERGGSISLRRVKKFSHGHQDSWKVCSHSSRSNA